uniref:TF-B3 domain-containing protein n=1 Tax=Aegilops tauschii subsp. strangulata TaxID=200361 RepID=A0A453HFD1_AEGTS
MPSLVAMMTKPSAKPYPDVVIPKDYALAHFPRKNQTIKLQLPEQSKKWYCEFHVKSNGGHCSLYDCGFVRDNHLLEGDLCVFQPMPNCKGRTFKVIVHLFRKATIDHPSSENISKRGLPSTKNTPTLCIKEEPKDDEETFSSGYDEHRISKKYPDHDGTEPLHDGNGCRTNGSAGQDSFGESWSHCIRSAHLRGSHDQDQCPRLTNLWHGVRCQIPSKRRS